MDNYLEVLNLTKCYGRKRAVDEFSMMVRKGSVTALLGPNGAGKTTVIKSVCGLIDFEQGSIRIGSRFLEAGSRSGGGNRRGSRGSNPVSAVLEGSRNIYWRMTVLENIRYFASLHGIKIDITRRPMDEYVSLLGLRDHLHTETRKLSTGYKQRTAIACCLGQNTDLLLLDEPTLGLDMFSVDSIVTLLEVLREKGKTILVTSHDLQFVQRCCSEIVVINEGRCMAADSVQALKSRFSENICTVECKDTDAVISIADRVGCRLDVLEKGEGVEFYFRDYSEFFRIMSDLSAFRDDIRHISIAPMNIDGILMQLYRG